MHVASCGHIAGDGAICKNCGKCFVCCPEMGLIEPIAKNPKEFGDPADKFEAEKLERMLNGRRDIKK